MPVAIPTDGTCSEAMLLNIKGKRASAGMWLGNCKYDKGNDEGKDNIEPATRLI